MEVNKTMKQIKLKLDFRKINSREQFYLELKFLFGFSDSYENNIHSVIDCLSCLRAPEKGITKIVLEKNETILLEIIRLSDTKKLILKDFLIAMESVNKNEIAKGNQPSIYLTTF